MADEELEGMGKKMVRYCGGLPLAISVLGGLLTKKYTVLEWQRVYENIQTQIVGKSVLDDNKVNSVNRLLSLSYEDLPMQLKRCFLYLAHFPEDYMIDVKELSFYWAAEGMIPLVRDGETIQKCGEDYLEELVRRNMVIVLKGYRGMRNYYCQMHDIMRDICLSKAKEENFLQVLEVPTSTSTINAQTPSRARRLVVHNANAFPMLGHENNRKCRSVLCFGVEGNSWKLSAPVFRSLPLLRVLDLENAKCKGGKLPSSIGELIHLRVLSLQSVTATISHLPHSLRNLKLLMYLDLSVRADQLVHVPNILKEMLDLRYLSLPFLMDSKTELELGDLVNLESLSNFSTKHSSVTDLLRMTRLTTLSIRLTSECTSEILSSSLRELKNLESFALIGLAYQGADFVLDFIHLKDLMLAIHMPRFPDQYRFPPNLEHINLINCRMEEDPMPILEKLLHLKTFVLSSHGFVGRRMVCSKGGFPQLHFLRITKQEDMEEWIVEEGTMPCLHTLVIDECKKLKELPDELKYITSLKELEIKNMNREWTKKLVLGGEHYYKVQHIPSVQFFNCDGDE